MNYAVWDAKSQFETYKGKEVFDCMIAEALLSEGRPIHSQEKVLTKYKVASLEELAEKQKAKLSEIPKLEKLFDDIEMPLIRVLWEMERTGILLDKECLENVGKELSSAIIQAEDEIKKEVGFDINLNSSIQVGNHLADKVGVPLTKTKTGRFATNEQELAQYKAQFPIIAKFLTYRMLSKLLSTYVTSLIGKIDETGRVHTTYHQVAVSTGRLASSNPNMQNIPVTSAYGKKIKSCFVASEGKTLLSFDYSQQELRILAHLTGEKKLIDAFSENRDVHKTTAGQLFSVSYEDVTKDQRSVAKMVNFGIIYGMSSYGLSMGLSIPAADAQTFIDRFFANYPAIKSYYDAYFKQAKIDGYVETLLGRRRYVFEFPGKKFIDNATRRVLLNFPIQGTAADFMKLAMVRIQKEVLDKDSSANLLLQIHDDLVFEITDDEKTIHSFVKKIKDIMCHVYPLSVPIEVDVKSGKRWGEMELI